MTSFLAALRIGLAVSTGEPFGLIAAAGLPFVCMLAGIRKAAFENALAYYAAGLWPMMPGLHRYFGASEGPLLPFICWIASAMLLTLPWAAAWSDQRRALVWRVPLALLASCVPPIGIIGFISPLTAAGYLFPATEWVGVAAVWLVPGLLLAADSGSARGFTVFACLALAVAGRVGSPGAQPIPGWAAINSNFGDLSNPLSEYAAAEFIQQTALTSRARVLIFPEAIVPRWSEATEAFWSRTIATGRERGQVLAFGAGIPARRGSFPGVYDFGSAIEALKGAGSGNKVRRTDGEARDNAVIITGAESGTVYQRVPVPIGMWRPFDRLSVPLRLSDSGVVTIAGHRAAVLICYEQILTFPVLASMLRHPAAIVAISNMALFNDTTVSRYQASAATSWANLFRVPLYFSVNS